MRIIKISIENGSWIALHGERYPPFTIHRSPFTFHPVTGDRLDAGPSRPAAPTLVDLSHTLVEPVLLREACPPQGCC
eukprot:354371-Chlamydomonas_euryale.AAC.5